jgi:hypothetical protein
MGAAAENPEMASRTLNFLIDLAPWPEFFVTERPVAVKCRPVLWRRRCGARIGRIGRIYLSLLLRDGGLQVQRRAGAA